MFCLAGGGGGGGGEENIQNEVSQNNKGLFGFRMCNKILCRSEKIETRSKNHDFSDRNSPVYVIQ